MVGERLHVGRRHVPIVAETHDRAAFAAPRLRQTRGCDRIEEAEQRAGVSDVVARERLVIGGAREAARRQPEPSRMRPREHRDTAVEA